MTRHEPVAPRSAPILTVGVLSDTHGHLYPRVLQLLQGVDHIVHAGDVGAPQVLTALRAIAPVTAVRGNCDHEAWAANLPVQAEVEVGGVSIVVAHVAPRAGASDDETPVVLVSGHSHLAAVEQRGGTLVLNPGSAGPRRFGRPRTIARLEIRMPAADGPPEKPRTTAEIVAAEE